MAAEIEVVKQLYAAINRNDVPAAVELLDPQIEWVEPDDFPTPGTYRGHEAVRAHITRGRGSWAEGSCDHERFIAAGDKIVVFLHARVRMKDRTDWIDGRFADVITFRNGSAIQVRTFGNRQDALGWAGAEAPDAS